MQKSGLLHSVSEPDSNQAIGHEPRAAARSLSVDSDLACSVSVISVELHLHIGFTEMPGKFLNVGVLAIVFCQGTERNRIDHVHSQRFQLSLNLPGQAKGQPRPVICRGDHCFGSTPFDHVGNHLSYPRMLTERYEQISRWQLARQEFVRIIDYGR